MGKDFIFILGGPGSGKGTQSAWIAENYGIGYMSTGDLLRAAIKKVESPPEGISEEELNELKQLAETMKTGGLVDDRYVINLIKRTMESGSQKHWFIDGFPRKMSQCELFVSEVGDAASCLFIDVKDEVLMQRLLERGKTSGRADDNEESIRKRLETFHGESQPVIDHYSQKNKVMRIDGERTIQEVRDDCITEIGKVWPDIRPVGVAMYGAGNDAPASEKPDAASKQEAKKDEEETSNSKCCLLI